MTRIYRFGDFRLVPATRELWRGDSPVAVPPRAFDCIVYLVEHRERAVGRDELIAAVWGRTETGDGTLGQTVLAARRALEDTGKEQHVIRTVFRFGYHWVAAVAVTEEMPLEGVEGAAPTFVQRAAEASTSDRVDSPDNTDTQTAVLANEPTRHRNMRRLVFAAVSLLVLCALVFAVLRWHERSAPSSAANTATQSRNTIALVLPVTVSADTGHDWVRLGLMDLIGGRLRAAGLAVVPSDNVVALTSRANGADGAIDIPALTRATGANLVISANAEMIGGRWRVTLRSVHGREPPLLAGGEASDVLAAARTASEHLAQQLGFAPVPAAGAAETDPLALANLSQQIEAAMLSDRLDAARALIASATPAQREQPEIRLRLAQIDYQAGDFDSAEAGFNAVAESSSVEQDAVVHARALSNLGVIAAVRENNPLAMQRFDQAIALLRREHAADALGKALMGRANITAQNDDYDAALRDMSEARVAFESTGNLLALAVLDSNLAALDTRRFRYAEAEPVFERAAGRFATFGVHAAELNALTGAAELQLALLEPDAALALDSRVRELIEQVSDPARKRSGELTRVELLAANGRMQEASSLLERTLEAAAQANDRAALARGHILAARVAMARGDAHLAATEAEAALQRLTAADDSRERARTLRLRVQALLALGDIGAAKQAVAALSDFAASDGTAPSKLYFHLAAAAIAAATGDASANDGYAQALGEADALRIPLDLREVASEYSAWLVRSGDLARAGATAERVAGWAARDYDSALVQLRVQRALGDENLWRGALVRARALAGERAIPAELLVAPPG
jgi:DNA-binding winged helix-turn-helix (wHTH) protein